MFRCFFFPIKINVNYCMYTYPGFLLYERTGGPCYPGFDLDALARPSGIIPSTKKSQVSVNTWSSSQA